MSAPTGIAIDITGNGLSVPKSIAFDSAGDIWVANSGDSSVSVFTNSGTAIGNYTGAGMATPVAIAVDPH
jgi:DNA-binding beta-propeller fold protein YncE